MKNALILSMILSIITATTVLLVESSPSLRNIIVPDGETPRQIDLSINEAIEQVPLHDLIRTHFETFADQTIAKPFYIAETFINHEGNIIHSYYKPENLSKWFNSNHTLRDPITNLHTHKTRIYKTYADSDKLEIASPDELAREGLWNDIFEPFTIEEEGDIIKIIPRGSFIDYAALEHFLQSHTQQPCINSRCCLDLNNVASLGKIPPEIFNHTPKIIKLNFGEHDLSEPYLEETDTGYLPPSITNLSHLEELNAIGCGLSTLPHGFRNLRNLRKLYLKDNYFPELSEEILELNRLEKLDLSFNQISTIPTAIERLQSLRKLNLCANELRTLPATIGQLQQLEKINLLGNSFPEIPTILLNMPQLKTISITINRRSSMFRKALAELQSRGVEVRTS